METLTIIFLVLAILGLFLTIYFGVKNKRLERQNIIFRKAISECKQKCANVCKVHFHQR